MSTQQAPELIQPPPTSILKEGNLVRGWLYDYKLGQEIAHGVRGHTFKVAIESCAPVDEDISEHGLVLKTVYVNWKKSPEEIFASAGQVNALLTREFLSLQRLGELPFVPRVYDFGMMPCAIPTSSNGNENVPLTFIIQEFMTGERLDKYLANRFGVDGNFTGIHDAKSWFDLAICLASSLQKIQAREVVHRDIWYENILVDDSQSERVRYIDFGDAYSRHELITEHPNRRSDEFVAPEILEGSRWPSRRADIYSLGGVLYFMATGLRPPKPNADADQLKNAVVGALVTHNPTLFEENHGIADIIARCLRCDHHRRIRDAECLLSELQLFSAHSSRLTVAEEQDRLNQQLNCEVQQTLPELFQRITAIELNHLNNMIEEMRQGSIDINGDHEQLASGLSLYLSVLDEGDEYLAVSTAEFWGESNAGMNGRVLSMNRILAQRGVKIRRLFLATRDELNDENSLFHQVVKIQREKIQGLTDPSNWEIRVKTVNATEKTAAFDYFKHFGVWIKQGQAVRLLPVYTRHGSKGRILRALRIRKYEGDADVLRNDFLQLWEDSTAKRIEPNS